MQSTASTPVRPWLWLAPGLLVLGWWLYDLHFQWEAIVDYQYGWMVALLAAYLTWERWPTRPTQDRPAPLWLCGLLVVLATPLLVVAELYKNGIAGTPSTSFLVSIASTLYLAALVLYAWGRATLAHFLFPLLFLFVAVPLPQILWGPIVVGLQGLITALNVETLNLLGIPAVQHANVIQLPRCVVGVDEACSGVRSLQSSIMATLFIGDLTLKRPGAKLAFLAAGMALALVGNFFRSLFLSLTAHREGIDALKHLHDTAGWSVLLFTAGGMIVLAWVVGRWEKKSAALSRHE